MLSHAVKIDLDKSAGSYDKGPCSLSFVPEADLPPDQNFTPNHVLVRLDVDSPCKFLSIAMGKSLSRGKHC